MKIYLAGPDVFRENAIAWLNRLISLCANYGHSGLSPLDNDVDLELKNASTMIFQGNIDLIKECDVVIANLEPFRGPNVDDGTAFEIGYAFALGKPIWGYMENYEDTLKEITSSYTTQYKFPHVEDFGLPRNLMIVEAIKASGGNIENTLSMCLYEL